MRTAPDRLDRYVVPSQAQLVMSLQRSGLSVAGIQQALQGSLVSDPADRATIARILTAFASMPPHATAALYDYPGEYAQRFDGVDKGGDE